MSLYRRKNSPYWYYDFRRAGVRYTGTTGTADKRAATRIERDLVASVEAAGGAPASDAPTVGALFLKYFLSHASHLPSVKTIEAHFIALQTRLDLDMLASELSNAHVSAYVADRRSDVSPATVNRELATLRAAHRMAAEAWEWSVRPIAWRRHMLKEPQGRTRWITTEEATRLIRALPPHLADAVEWSLLTGCRRGETFDLDWARVDLNNRVVRVFGKGAKWRNVYLSKQAFLLLANLPGDQTGLVFSKYAIRRTWARACAEVGLEDFRWHDLRHTFATWLRREGAPLEVVKQALGHASIEMTMRYAHVERDEVRAAVELVRVAK